MLQPIRQPMTPPMMQATSPITQLMLPAFKQTPLQIQGKTLEPNLRQCKLTALKAVNVDV
jgi:hypothetical protein